MIKAILLDIEGTIGDIAFVRDVLFPYARARVEGVLKAHWTDAEITATVASARVASGLALADAHAAAGQFIAWIDDDKKITPLKSLQGIIWREGYQTGELKAHLYLDAVEAMQTWHGRGLKLCIYSSGSVEAQKLYLAHCVAGDLAPLISGYFDTTTGPKAEPVSYSRISASLALPPNEIVFFSDAAAETQAARAAGFEAFDVDRKLPSAHAANGVIATFASVMDTF